MYARSRVAEANRDLVKGIKVHAEIGVFIASGGLAGTQVMVQAANLRG